MTKSRHATSLLVHGAILLTLVVTARQLWTTDLGMEETLSGGHRLVTDVDRDGAAARAGVAIGDEILEDPGRITFVAPWTEREIYEWNYGLHRVFERGHVPMRLRRGDTTFEVDVVPPPAPNLPAALRHLRLMGTYLPTAFAFLAVAALLVRRQRAKGAEANAARLIAASSAFFGPCWVISWATPAWPLWLYPVSSLLDVCAGACGVLTLAMFAWSYPLRARVVDVRWVRALVLWSAGACAAYSVLNSMHVVDPIPGLHGNTTIIVHDSVMAVVVVVGFAWQRKHAVNVVARRQATWLLVFSGLGMFVPIFGLILPEHAFGWCTPILHKALFPFPVLIPIGFTAVVARYRLFALDGFALRAGPYAIALVTSLVVCIAITLGVEALVSDWNGPHGVSRWLGIIAAIVLTEPLRRAAQRLIDFAFSRDRDAFLTRCTTLAARVARDANAEAIEAEVRRVLDAREASLFSLSDLVDPTSAALVDAALAKHGTMRVLDLPSADVVDVLHARGFELLVAVPSDETGAPIPSTLALTLPIAAHDLAAPERDALALVGRIVGATLAREAARSALVRERVRAEDERRHIAMELHDSVGAALAAARVMTRRLREPASGNAPAGGTLDALDAMLREGLGDLRTSLWSLDPGEASWENLVARIRRHVTDRGEAAGVATDVVVEGNPGRSLSPALRLCILRIVQESTSNALKHASPKHLVVRLRANDDGFELAIEDDGTGLPTTFTFGHGIGNMSRRVEASSGTFRIEGLATGGTRVSAFLPLRSEAHPAGTPVLEGTTP